MCTSPHLGLSGSSSECAPENLLPGTTGMLEFPQDPKYADWMGLGGLNQKCESRWFLVQGICFIVLMHRQEKKKIENRRGGLASVGVQGEEHREKDTAKNLEALLRHCTAEVETRTPVLAVPTRCVDVGHPKADNKNTNHFSVKALFEFLFDPDSDYKFVADNSHCKCESNLKTFV